MTVPQRVIERIKTRIVVQGGCWLWPGAATIKGYGQIGWHENGLPCRGLVHRLMYEAANGAISDGLQLDHLCHDPKLCVGGARCPHRRCCNPAHLEPVSNRVNVLRGGGFAAVNASRISCPQGHPYDDANTYSAPDGWRQCRACRSEHVRAIRARRHSGKDVIGNGRKRYRTWYDL